MDAFSAMQGVMLVSQRLVWLEEESSPCPRLRRADWGFLLNVLSSSQQMLLGKKVISMPGLKTASNCN